MAFDGSPQFLPKEFLQIQKAVTAYCALSLAQENALLTSLFHRVRHIFPKTTFHSPQNAFKTNDETE